MSPPLPFPLPRDHYIQLLYGGKIIQLVININLLNRVISQCFICMQNNFLLYDYISEFRWALYLMYYSRQIWRNTEMSPFLYLFPLFPQILLQLFHRRIKNNGQSFGVHGRNEREGQKYWLPSEFQKWWS